MFNLRQYLNISCYINKISLEAKAKAKAWTSEAKAMSLEAKAKASKFGLEAKAWPRGLHH